MDKPSSKNNAAGAGDLLRRRPSYFKLRESLVVLSFLARGNLLKCLSAFHLSFLL